MKSVLFIFSIILALATACTPEASHPTYTGETSPSVKKEFNQTVARSDAGFSKSYRAAYASAGYVEPDPLFREAQRLLQAGNSNQWEELSTGISPLVEALNSKEKSTEVQLLCLMMIDRVFLPQQRSTPAELPANFYQQFSYYFEKLINNKGIDLDIMTNAFLVLKDHFEPLKVTSYSSYLVETARHDLASSQEQLNKLQDDEQAFGDVSKRIHEQIIAEAEFTLSQLKQVK